MEKNKTLEGIKKCGKCGKIKSFTQYYKERLRVDGCQSVCKICSYAQSRKWQKDNLNKVKAQTKKWRADNSGYQKKWYKENFEKIKVRRNKYYKENLEKCRIRHKRWYKENLEKAKAIGMKWRKNNKKKVKAYSKKYYKNCPIIHRMRTRIRVTLKHGAKSAVTIKLLGCSIKYLKKRFEKLFQPGMSWENMKEWHIDHIRPCASFDLTKPEEQRKCFHYKNLQPLWKKDNLNKGTKLDWEKAV